MIFKTVSGSHYEIQDGYIRRINPLEEKRADGEWIELIEEPNVVVGERVTLVMKSLAPYGPDDYEKTIRGDVLGVTARITTEVERIDE